MPISDNILQKIKERAANNIMGINPANTNCDVVIAHYGSKIMKDPLLNKMFLNGRTQVACALDFTSIDKAWSSIEETLNGVAAERKKVLGESSPDRLGTVLLLLIEKADDIPKIKPIVEQINNRNKKIKIKTIAVLRFALNRQKGLIQMTVCRGTFRTA